MNNNAILLFMRMLITFIVILLKTTTFSFIKQDIYAKECSDSFISLINRISTSFKTINEKKNYTINFGHLIQRLSVFEAKTFLNSYSNYLHKNYSNEQIAEIEHVITLHNTSSYIRSLVQLFSDDYDSSDFFNPGVLLYTENVHTQAFNSLKQIDPTLISLYRTPARKTVYKLFRDEIYRNLEPVGSFRMPISLLISIIGPELARFTHHRPEFFSFQYSPVDMPLYINILSWLENNVKLSKDSDNTRRSITWPHNLEAQEKEELFLDVLSTIKLSSEEVLHSNYIQDFIKELRLAYFEYWQLFIKTKDNFERHKLNKRENFLYKKTIKLILYQQKILGHIDIFTDTRSLASLKRLEYMRAKEQKMRSAILSALKVLQRTGKHWFPFEEFERLYQHRTSDVDF